MLHNNNYAITFVLWLKTPTRTITKTLIT